MLTNSRYATAGFSLIEVLVVLVITCVGLLGMAGLQANALRFNKTAGSRSVSSQLAYDLSDRIRSNLGGAVATTNPYLVQDSYAVNLSTNFPLPTCYDATTRSAANCTSAQTAQIDLAEWFNNIRTNLPAGAARIEPLTGFTNGLRIIVGYREPNAASTVSNCPASFSIPQNESANTPPVKCFVVEVAP